MKRVFLAAWCGLLAGGFIAVAAPQIENGEIVLAAPLVFETGRAELSPASDAALGELAEFLNAKTALTLVRVEGHVAAGGDEARNQALSEQRALAVCRRLAARGVDCRRLLAVGFGGTKPVADATTPEGRAKNTRITIKPAALRGNPIGGLPADGGGRPAGTVCEPAP